MDIGIDVSKLEEGTKVIIETKNSIYELTAGKGDEITILGGLLKNGDYRYASPTPAIMIGSTLETDGMVDLKRSWIGKGRKIEIQIDKTIHSTTPVWRAQIESPDGSWIYSMEW